MSSSLSAMRSTKDELQREGVILYFYGPVTQGVVEGLGNMMRSKLRAEEVSLAVSERIFAVLVEQLQNVINYSEPLAGGKGNGSLGVGELVVARRDAAVHIQCGNRIPQALEERIHERMSALRTMNKEDLKAYFRKLRRAGPDELSKGAGLGFVEMARHASRPLEYEIVPMDGSSSFFSVQVVI